MGPPKWDRESRCRADKRCSQSDLRARAAQGSGHYPRLALLTVRWRLAGKRRDPSPTSAPALREFVRGGGGRPGLPARRPSWGRARLTRHDPARPRPQVGLQSGDLIAGPASFAEADSRGCDSRFANYDLWSIAAARKPGAATKKVICHRSLPAEIDEYFLP